MFNAQPILIVEDEPLIAAALSEAISALEGKVIGPLATVREALKILDRVVIVAAILDAKLLDRDITPVAVKLQEAGIPFVLYTGTGPPEALALRCPDLAVLMKPASPRSVARRLLVEIRKCGC